MKAVLQRVAGAAVSVEGTEVGAIGPGLLVFVGAETGDVDTDADVLARKIAGLRVFSDDEGRMNLSVLDLAGEVLLVSQFTLVADVARGRRPSFTRAADPSLASGLVERVASGLRHLGIVVAEGRFGAKMEVSLVNDGPVTVLVDVAGGKVL